MTDALGTFDGRPVVATDLKLTNTGDGLSKSQRTAPKILHEGDVVDIVIRAKVTKFIFEPGTGKNGASEDEFIRVQQASAMTATIIDDKVVAKALDDQAKRDKLAEEEAKGIQRLPEVGDDGAAAGDEKLTPPTPIKGRAKKAVKKAAPKS